MKHSELLKNFYGHAIYQITVSGKVDPTFIKNQNKLEVTHTKTDGRIISTLTGEIKDQPGLNKILNKLYDYRYAVISILKIK